MLTTCKKMPELKVYDLKLTSENVAYSQTSAEIKVEYDYPTNLEYVNVTMSESNYFGYSIVAQSEIIDSVFIANFVDLHTDKKYYYKFEYSNGVNVVTSEVRSFYLDAALVTLPTVITMEVSEIQGTSAICGGEIIDDGGYYVTGRGVCWSTHRNPTIFDNYTTDGMDTGSYTSTMTGLSEHTVYYVRAFAINEKGTSYGTEYEFETTEGGGVVIVPTVTTSNVTDITSTSAICGGVVANSGGADVTARGVCWSTTENPTISDAHTSDGTGTGTFTSSLTNLTPQTTYYVRAYATNEAGTAYGEQKTFTTEQDSPNAPTGAINGLFTINENGDKVWFSQGNLQYQASTNTWRFADNQWDYVGEDNSNISETYSGWIDLFAWGTSGYNHGANCYQPWSTSITHTDYFAYGDVNYNLNDQTGQADWGFNPISNGGNNSNIWYSLSIDEWDYLLNTRTTISGIRFAKAIVNGINGVILVPENWISSIYDLNNPDSYNTDFDSNTISLSVWLDTFEINGAVFLSAAGNRRYGTSVEGVGTYGHYWSSTRDYSQENMAQDFFFDNTDLRTSVFHRCDGQSVRLVLDAQ